MNTRWSTRLDAAEVQHLVEDLGRGQVAAELHRAGGAERARQRAAGLRGDADRAAPVAVAHQHGLDGAAVVGVEERLDGAVGGVRLADERQRGERDRRRPAARAARPAGRSSRRSRAAPLAAQRQTCRARKAGSPAQRACRAARGPRHYRGSMRLAKYLAHAGVASRRASETLIAAGRVTVDGEVVTDPARDVDDTRDGRGRRPPRPRGRATRGRLRRQQAGRRRLDRARPAGAPTVVALVPSRERLYPVGRLDADTTGLILLTNDGDLAHRLTHPSLRGPAHLPRARAPRAGARAGAARAARGRRARRRPDRAGAGAPDRRRPHRDHDPRGPQAPGPADVRGGRASRCVAGAGAFGPLRLGGLEPRRAPRADARRRSSACAGCGSNAAAR